MRGLLACLLAGLCFVAPVRAERFAVPPSFWLEPRSGAAVIAEPAVGQAVGLYLDRPRARIVLHHAREDEAQARAEELRGWLIALGVDGTRIELAADGGVDRMIGIEVTPE